MPAFYYWNNQKKIYICKKCPYKIKSQKSIEEHNIRHTEEYRRIQVKEQTTLKDYGIELQSVAFNASELTGQK